MAIKFIISWCFITTRLKKEKKNPCPAQTQKICGTNILGRIQTSWNELYSGISSAQARERHLKMDILDSFVLGSNVFIY